MSSSALLPATGVRVVFLDEAGAKQSGALEVLWGTGFERDRGLARGNVR